MAFALRPEDYYHTGIVVPDLEAAMTRLSALAGYRWITPLTYTLPFRTVNGTRELTSTFVYSLQSPHLELIRAALGLAQWGESRGIATVSVDEHHATGHGWSCNPIMAAAMFLARTSTLIASVDCALGPLWNPVRLAEDIALVDNMSRGRLHTTVGLGYRSVEFDSLGVDFSRRGRLMNSLVERMLAVWSGAEPGVCTGTWTKPHPPLYVGGGSLATARRAARFRLPLS